jgi:hypothetical protein
MNDVLGNIKKVNIRKVWPNEQQDFTPWLALDENITQLGNAVGFELEVENTEVAVGPYSADILAKDSGTGKYVVIENQFGKTNHDHLGKLITYGSTLDASAVIWITEEFTEEHQKALDWLNDHTSDDVSFYGVVLELLQIDDSKPAVRFNVVSRPAEIIRQAAIAKAGEPLSDARKLQFDFWTEFRKQLLESKVIPSAQAAQPHYWFNVPLGKSGVVLSNIANTYENRIGVRVYLTNKIANIALTHLKLDQESIEKEIGVKLAWNPNPDKRDKIIAVTRKVNLEDRKEWPENIIWMVDMVSRFRKAFMPRLKKMPPHQNSWVSFGSGSRPNA